MGLPHEEKGCKLREWWSWKVRKARNKRDKGTVATEFKTCSAWSGAHKLACWSAFHHCDSIRELINFLRESDLLWLTASEGLVHSHLVLLFWVSGNKVRISQWKSVGQKRPVYFLVTG